MYISFNEFRVLRTLSDGEQHDKAPKGLTDAQFCIAVQLLKRKDLVYATFEEGGKVVSSQINMAGRAVLADLKELEKYGLKPKYDEDTGEIKGFISERIVCKSIFIFSR